MGTTNIKTTRRRRRHKGIRKRVFGTPERPRLAVFRSNQNIYVQVIDDVHGRTLAAATSDKLEKGSSMEAAKQVGSEVAEKAKSAGITKVAFDRGGFRYQGRVRALADAAREGGLEF